MANKTLSEVYREIRAKALLEMELPGGEGKSEDEKNAMLKNQGELSSGAEVAAAPGNTKDAESLNDEMNDVEPSVVEVDDMDPEADEDDDTFADGTYIEGLSEADDMEDLKDKEEMSEMDDEEEKEMSEADDMEDQEEMSEQDDKEDLKDKEEMSEIDDMDADKEEMLEMDDEEEKEMSEADDMEDPMKVVVADVQGDAHANRPADQEGGEKKPIELGEHVKAILKKEKLSKATLKEATTLFEAAVGERVATERAKLQKKFDAALDKKMSSLVEKLDTYLEYVADQYIKENQLAIDAGLKVEIMEDFVDGMKNLFTEHYIDIPAKKVDVVAQMGKKIQDLEAHLDQHLTANVKLAEQIDALQREKLIAEGCEGLTLSEKEKMKALVEEVKFNNPKDFSDKLGIIRKKYFPTKKKLTESSNPAEASVLIEEKEVDPTVQKYAAAISKTSRK